MEEDIEELKRLFYANALTQYGKRKLIGYYEQQIKELEENRIPISLVKEKIKELKEEGNYKTLENPDGRVHFQAEPCDYKIQVLQDLLEKGE